MRKTIFTLLSIFLISGANAESSCSFFDDVFVNGEFLWWRGKNDFMNTTISTFTSNQLDTVFTTKPYTYGWDPGFRVGLGTDITLGCAAYSIYADFTYFRGTDSQSFRLSRLIAQEFFNISTPLSFLGSQPVGTIVDYSSSTDFRYNRLDVGISKVFYESCKFSVLPKIAFSYMYTHQAMNEQFNIASPNAPRISSTRAKNLYSGYGLALGMDSYYKLVSGLSVYGMLDICGYLGQQTFSSDFTRLGLPSGVLQATINNNLKTSSARWLSDMQIGLQYEGCLFSYLQVAGRIGWEFLYLPQQNIANISYASDPLKLSGFVVGMEIGF